MDSKPTKVIVTETTKDNLTDYPKVLYKYRSWKNPFHQNILKEQTVYLSRPSEFSDPKDCKLETRYDLYTDEFLLKKALEDLKDSGLNEPEKQLRALELVRNSPIKNPDHIKNVEAATRQFLDDHLGVLCLTGNPTNNEMWGEYSDNHTGFCVGFNARKLFDYIGGGGPIDYCDELPYLLPDDDFLVKANKTVYSKERKYEFEREYRTFKSVSNQEDRVIKLPKDCYAHIIFGAGMDENEIQQIIQICDKENCWILIKINWRIE